MKATVLVLAERPGRLRLSGRNTAVRAPRGYMSTWAPTQATSVSPPVSVEGRQSPRSPDGGGVSTAGSVCQAGRRLGSSVARTAVAPVRPPPAAALVSALQVPGYVSVHRTVMLVCGGVHTVGAAARAIESGS